MAKRAPYKIRFQLYKMSWSSGQSPTSRLTVKLDENFKILNPRSIACHSSHGWGTWQHPVKLKTKLGHAWIVSTPGHGGIILVTQNKLPETIAKPVHDLTCVRRGFKDWGSGRELYDWIPNWGESFDRLKSEGNPVAEIYVYDFEEDCDWAIPVLLDERLAEDLLKKEYSESDKGLVDLQNSARETIARWQTPEVCQYFNVLPKENNCHIERAAKQG